MNIYTMIHNSFGAFLFMGLIFTSTAVFKDYCKSGLCENVGGDGQHTGCPDGKLTTGEFGPKCKEAVLHDIDEVQKKMILDFHNYQRNYVAGGGLTNDDICSACRMGVVEWDEELVLTAELHARNCIFAHDRCRNTVKYVNSGQNLGEVKQDATTPMNITYRILQYMELWYLEYRDVTQKIIDVYKKGKKMTGHFLTMVNERANRIGCSGSTYKVNDKNAYMLVCNYATISINRFPIYNSCKEPGSLCTSGVDAQYPNLCKASENYNYDGVVELIPNKAGCKVGTDPPKELEIGDGTKPGAKPGGKPGAKPGGKPGAKPGGKEDDKDDGDADSKPGYRKGGRNDGCSGGLKKGVRVVSIDDDEYFDYAMGPYPGFSSTLSQSHTINKQVLIFSIMFTGIYHIILKY